MQVYSKKKKNDKTGRLVMKREAAGPLFILYNDVICDL